MRRRYDLRGFQGFWCKQCTGRVFEEETYYEVDPLTRKKIKKVGLVCLMCSRSRSCEYKDYIRLLENIERILIKKRALAKSS